MSDQRNQPQTAEGSVIDVEPESVGTIVVDSWRAIVWRRFRKHRLATIAAYVLIGMYLVAILCEFISPYLPAERFPDYLYATPTRIRIFHDGRLSRPFIYGIERRTDPQTFRRTYVVDRERRYPVRFFVAGSEYKLWGLIPARLHLISADGHPLLLFGADALGRDVFSRILYGSRISLTIGLIGVAITFVLGLVLGGLSGYVGGLVDALIQRTSDLLMSLPTIPLWMALSAALPRDWPPLRIYLGIVMIFSIIGWTGLARVVRGKILSLRNEDFVTAAVISGATPLGIIRTHLLPNFAGYILVSLTLAIPGMILGETALSFIGLGLQAPVVSWGTMLQSAQDLQAIAYHPWLLIPCLFVILAVLMFNFLGDGIRDAVDPQA